jgi:hypothetical protein
MDNFAEDFLSVADFSANLGKDSRDIKKCLKVVQGSIGTIVYALAINVKDFDKNTITEISDQGGQSLNHEAYDHVRDVYHVSCCDFHKIGLIPVSYSISIVDSSWSQDIPLPISLIKRYMTEEQNVFFNEWIGKYKSNQFSIEYIQMLDIF